MCKINSSTNMHSAKDVSIWDMPRIFAPPTKIYAPCFAWALLLPALRRRRHRVLWSAQRKRIATFWINHLLYFIYSFAGDVVARATIRWGIKCRQHNWRSPSVIFSISIFSPTRLATRKQTRPSKRKHMMLGEEYTQIHFSSFVPIFICLYIFSRVERGTGKGSATRLYVHRTEFSFR